MDRWFAQLSEPRSSRRRSGSRPTATMSCAAGRPCRRPAAVLPMAMTGQDQRFDYQGSVDFRVPGSTRRARVFTSLPIDLFADRRGRRCSATGQGPHRPDRRRPARPRPVRNACDPPRRPRPRAGLKSMPPCPRNCSTGACRAAVSGCRPVDRGRPGRPVRHLHRDARRPALGRCAGRSSASSPSSASAPFLFEWHGIDTYGLPAFGWLARLAARLCGDRRGGARGRLRAATLRPVGARQISAARHCRADPARSRTSCR